MINNKVYIGQSIRVQYRWIQHKRELNNNRHINSHLQRAWNMYKKDNFKFEIIEECKKEELNDKEVQSIKYYNSCSNGYNQDYGANLKMSLSNKLIKKVYFSEETTSRGINKAQEVEPIKNLKDIKKIKQFLLGKKNKRDYMLFVVGINVGLRAGDLLKLQINDIMEGTKIKDEVIIEEEKTNKRRTFSLNKSAKEAIQIYLDSIENYNANDFIFQSQKGGHIKVEYAHKLVKGTLRELNIKGNYGTHTLRKTFDYHMRKMFLMKLN